MWKLILDLLVFNVFLVGCQNKYNIEKVTKEPLPEFRKRVEEIIEDTEDTVFPVSTITDDPNQNIVSFLIQNVKEIFQDTYDSSEDFETQTKTVNEIRKKERGDLAYHVDVFSDKIDKISNYKLTAQQVTDNQEIKSTYFYDPSPLTITSNISENNLNLKLVEKQNSGRKNIVQQEVKNGDDEEKFAPKYFQKSTLLFRPVLQIVKSSDTTPFYYNTRPTKLVISEFMNVSQTKCTENTKITSQDDNMPDDNELIENYGEFKIIELDPLPFLTNRKSAEGLIFLSNHKENANTVQDEETTEIKLSAESTTTLAIPDSEFDINETNSRRSCIKCDNAAVAWCSVPKYKLIPSVVCTREADICCSMHTPFGIVERGCFNVNYNFSTHVCGGNVCNYIPYSDLPVIYTTKQEWIKNVHELSHFRSLRRTTLRNLRCLNCEVNSTIFGDMNYNNNCLEGNIEVVQLVECEENEMCGIKALKSQGYIWRGCTAMPQYNYYVTLCDWDLCNVDPIASIYDNNE